MKLITYGILSTMVLASTLSKADVLFIAPTINLNFERVIMDCGVLLKEDGVASSKSAPYFKIVSKSEAGHPVNYVRSQYKGQVREEKLQMKQTTNSSSIQESASYRLFIKIVAGNPIITLSSKEKEMSATCQSVKVTEVQEKSLTCPEVLENLAQNMSFVNGMSKDLARKAVTEVSETINDLTKYSIFVGSEDSFDHYEIISGAKTCGIVSFEKKKAAQ